MYGNTYHMAQSMGDKTGSGNQIRSCMNTLTSSRTRTKSTRWICAPLFAAGISKSRFSLAARYWHLVSLPHYHNHDIVPVSPGLLSCYARSTTPYETSLKRPVVTT